MKLNEQKLTDYVLNELTEDERRAVETELETDPAARKAVEEIRKLTEQLTAHYAEEELICLTDEQREAIYAAARKKKTKIIPFPPRYVWMPLTSVAALAVIILHIATPRSNEVNMPSLATPEEIAPAAEPPPRPKMELKKAPHKPAVKVRPRMLARGLQKTDAFYPAEAASAEGGLCSGNFEQDGLIYNAAAIKSEQAPEPAKSQWGPSIENYAEIKENAFTRVSDEPLSTFSIDVDTASYANVRRFLKEGQLPPKDAVRIEEMINYFDYAYEPPAGKVPFAARFAQSDCPWNRQHKLVRIALKGREIAQAARPPLNLVFLLDVSGSMNDENKLPLVKRSMEMLVNQLDERDRVSIVVYAGASGLVLPPTSGADRQAILSALKRLNAGGGTNGGQGIELAYKTALENFHKEGVNRVILCTDGDFNIGVTQGGDMNRLIEEKAKRGIFLSVLGFGMGNYKDGTLEGLADRGNGNYAYIDTFSEARKVLVDQMSGTLVTIAKDVKIQVEFNPARVAGYRLIGYENRMLATKDFNDDTKDAGEIGAGHTVTALYELIPAGQPVNNAPPVDELKYQLPSKDIAASDDLLTVKLRYKQPDSDTSSKLEFPLKDEDRSFEKTDKDFRFAAAVAGFGMLLRDSEYKGDLTYNEVIKWAQGSLGKDEFGYRRECIDLVRNAAAIKK
jgi:Ca-activated chloride channel family protein